MLIIQISAANHEQGNAVANELDGRIDKGLDTVWWLTGLQELGTILHSEALGDWKRQEKKKNEQNNFSNYLNTNLPDFKLLFNLQHVKISWLKHMNYQQYLGWPDIAENDMENLIAIEFINPYTEKPNCIISNDLPRTLFCAMEGLQFRLLLPNYMYRHVKGNSPKEEDIVTNFSADNLEMIIDCRGNISVPNVQIFIENWIKLDDIFHIGANEKLCIFDNFKKLLEHGESGEYLLTREMENGQVILRKLHFEEEIEE